MSEISIYDIVPTPKLADKLIGTSVGGVIEDVTYNFTLQELLQLFIPNLPANNLQGVLDYGNTATQNINLTGTITTTNLSVLATANILNSNLSGNTRVMAGLFDRTNASGTAGQFLRSTGTQVEWFTIPTVIPTLQQVLQSGNTSNISIVLTANITAVTATADTVISNTSLNVNGVLRDGIAAVGASNQILSSTGSGVRWVDMPVYNVVSPLLYDTPTKTFSIQVASSSQSGYLSSADWINFDGKQDAIILTTSGTSGAATFVANTLNIPVYSPDLSGYVPTTRTLTINGVTYDLSANRSWTIPAGVASVTATAPLSSSGGANPDISISQSSSSADGYLSNVDWLTFNSKQGAITLTTTGTSGPSTLVGTTLNIPQYQSVLTNPITGSGTVNYVPKFNTTSSITDSNIQDSGSLITLGSDSYISSGALGIGTSSLTQYNLRASKNITGGTTAYGIYLDSTLQSDVTNVGYMFMSAPSIASSFAANNVHHFRANPVTLNSGSSIITQVGYMVSSAFTNATANFAFRSDMPATSGSFNLYMGGTANNYLAGSLGIGSTALTGYNLRIAKDITGGVNSYGIMQDSTVQSDVTNAAYIFTSNPSTQATSFTLGTLMHYRAIGTTIGAGNSITTQVGFSVQSTMTGATNNFGFSGNLTSATGVFNLYMAGSAENYLNGNVGIGVSQTLISSGPILTSTLTNGGSGYVDGTYTDVAVTIVSSNGANALYTIVVSGGVVTSATLTWAGTNYKVGNTITVSNTLLGGTGSGLIITVSTVDSSQLKISNVNGGDITLYRSDTSLVAGDNYGTIKWESNDASTKASGIQAEIGAYAAGTSGGAYLSFYTRSVTAGTSLVEAMRIDSRGGVGIGATVLTQFGLKVAKNITGSVSSYGITSEGIIQSDVTSNAYYNYTSASTAASTFTLTNLYHYVSTQGTFGAGSTVTNQFGFFAANSLIGAVNNFGFYGNIAAGTNRWNLYMNGTALNYLAGNLLIGSTTDNGIKLQVTGQGYFSDSVGIGQTSLANYNLRITKNITGATTSYAIRQDGIVQSDSTTAAYGMRNDMNTAAASFTVATYNHYYATEGTIGAGSAVTNQYGFTVTSSMTSATNNYGFFGAIAAGTNRWNLYMGGTAQNYLAGALSIGVTTANASALLQVDSTTKGFLPPRMTAAQRTAIASPATGLIVFQTDGVEGLWLRVSTGWVELTVV